MKKITNYIEENKGKKTFPPFTEEQYEKVVSIMENRLKEGEIQITTYKYDSNGNIVEDNDPCQLPAEELVKLARVLAQSGLLTDDDNS